MNSDCNFYVFREGRRTLTGEHLLGALRGSLSRARDENSWVDALLHAGELECGLEDAGDSRALEIAALTNACARKLVSWSLSPQPELMTTLPLRLEGEVTVSTPEGFAYYALHPRQYAEVVNRLGQVSDAVVIGIRSIGTTLSAMTAAALRRKGTAVERFTVRPIGHPFDRSVEWTQAQLHIIRAARQRHALFVIVDEGPGLSGSSFLSVAEALGAQRVPLSQIVLVPSHAPQLPSLRAKDAAARWKRFTTVNLPEGRYPSGKWIGGGKWRELFGGKVREWPGAWTAMERAKFLSEDVSWKFEGHGGYGTRARAIGRALGDAGFSPKVVDDQYGYVGYEYVRGRTASRADLNAERLRTLASYCAFRAQEFSCEVAAAQRHDLASMVRVNYQREFGARLPLALLKLPVAKPTVCDAKMSPHEWLIADDGRFLKLDATNHGDDHFFPGPCDIAWDLAGAIVEWGMDAAAREVFLREYTAHTHEDASLRIRNYLLAYCVFRMAWSNMAAAGMRGTPDEPRLRRDALRYRAHVERVLTSVAAAAPAAIAS